MMEAGVVKLSLPASESEGDGGMGGEAEPTSKCERRGWRQGW